MTDQELRDQIIETLPFVPGTISSIIRLIKNRERQAQLAILDQVRMAHQEPRDTWNVEYNAVVDDLNHRINTLKAGIESKETE